MKWKNGHVYVGYWVDDKRHGQGKLKYANGSVQKGRWENDQFLSQ